MSGSVWANLYLTTEYQEANKPPVVTKHHIFLNRRYPVEYIKMAYSLTLTKIEKDRGTIETETFIFNKGKKELLSGGIAHFTMGKPVVLEQFSKSGKREFILKIIPDRIVP
jgi:hypothetical protein